jgi:8-oxo-dGTP diphosphatase
MNEQKWDQPLISVDVIAIKLDKQEGKLKVFLGLRKFEPFKGTYSLPGVLLSPHERVAEAAQRAVNTKALVLDSAIRAIRDIGISDNPDRDPRGATLSVVNLAVIDSDFTVSNSEDVKLVAIDEINAGDLPFDHENLLLKALTQLGSLLMSDKEVSKALLGDQFRTTELYDAYADLSSALPDVIAAPDLSNLSRRLKTTKGIAAKSAESVTSLTSSRGRPSSSWAWE